jgi:hypothetical protein
MYFAMFPSTPMLYKEIITQVSKYDTEMSSMQPLFPVFGWVLNKMLSQIVLKQSTTV